MIKLRILVVHCVVVLLLAVTYGKGMSVQSFINDMRQIDFKNFTFSRSKDEKGAEVIQFRDGRYVGREGLNYSLMRFAYGDLTSDANEEAIILLRGQNSPTGRTLDEVFIYTSENGKVVLLTSLEGGKRGDYICSVLHSESNFKVADNLLIIDQAVAFEGDHNLIPTRYYTITYRLDGKRMKEVERSALKPLPEHRREIG